MFKRAESFFAQRSINQYIIKQSKTLDGLSVVALEARLRHSQEDSDAPQSLNQFLGEILQFATETAERGNVPTTAFALMLLEGMSPKAKAELMATALDNGNRYLRRFPEYELSPQKRDEFLQSRKSQA